MGKYVAADFMAAGVFTDSATAKVTRAATNWPTELAKACPMPAKLHIATAKP